MTNKKKHEETELDKTLKLLALVAVRGMKLKEQVSFMSRAGFERNQMARLLGTTPNSISVRLSELKKESSKQKASEKKGAAKKEM